MSEQTPELQQEIIESTLAAFGCKAKIIAASFGPRVATYTLGLPKGTRARKVELLEKDLAIALGQRQIRVVTGDRIALEVPIKGEAVKLADMQPPAGSPPLTMPLGKDSRGENVHVDLADLPHLLVCGATGSGKSTWLHSTIASLAVRNSPQRVAFAMIDPKRVELSVWAGLPHLIAPVATDVGSALGLLDMLCAEMERRYTLLQEAKLRSWSEVPNAGPLIVLVIDELADLMLVAKDAVEPRLCRLAQLARAAGIYTIAATQRPDAKVITGLIKANFPSRIAFAVPSAVDSRVILDQNGADKLLGYGDMLYRKAGTPVQRVQGCWITSEIIAAVLVNMIAKHAPAVFMDPRPAPKPPAEIPPYRPQEIRIVPMDAVPWSVDHRKILGWVFFGAWGALIMAILFDSLHT